MPYTCQKSHSTFWNDQVYVLSSHSKRPNREEVKFFDQTRDPGTGSNLGQKLGRNRPAP